KKKYDKKMVRVETKSYQAQLELEINQDRENHGKKPFPPKEKEEAKEIKVSKTDPDSGYYVKDEREKMFAYSFHTACDDHLRHTEINKNIYEKRKETIERVFADGKEKHGMRWTTLRGLG